MSEHRLPTGGAIDRQRLLTFYFDSRRYTGFAGDTLASALLANGVKIVGRSFKYHRPRGVMAAGVEESNALVKLESGAISQVNLRATEVILYDGLTAWPVNCWPSARFDVGAINGLFSRFLPAGFYYKTFMWPRWHLFENFIRRAAGLGRPSVEPDPDTYDTAYVYCDVLIVGAGPCGLAAALASARSGARVMLCDSDELFGGSLLSDETVIDGLAGTVWLEQTLTELRRHPETTLKQRTMAVGYFDHNSVALVEAVPRVAALSGRVRQRLWQVRAQRVILATGAIERPLVFPGNDRPGVLLATALRTYLARYAVRVGERLVIFTNNDSAYATARAHLHSGGTIAAIVDTRQVLTPELSTWVSEQHLPLYAGAQIVGTKGRDGLQQVHIRQANGRLVKIDADALGMSGGFNPTVHLFSQSGGQLTWDGPLALFKPDVSSQQETSVGACGGHFDLQASLPLAYHAGAAAAAAAGYRLESECAVPQAQTNHGALSAVEPVWRIAGEGKAFVDFQNDVTADDIVLAARENYASVEHLKRYTTLGMAPDQGKTSNVNALALLGEITGRSPSQTGTTRFRFPFAPVSMGALAGRSRSTLYRPMRHLACHAQHVAAGAAFDDYGGWQRPAHYLRSGESPSTAQRREAAAVRTTVGIFDASPLGKFMVKGPSAAAFLDRVYANTMSTLPIGHLRYGMMLNEFGVIVDDGVTARVGQDEFCVGTSSGGAAKIGNWLEQWLQCEWPQYEVLISPFTAAWSVITLSGPRAREVMNALDINFSVAAADFAHMTLRNGTIGDMQVRVMRVSFTGEVSFEINLANSCAPALWGQLMAAGANHSITPIGIDAWDALRIEKGYLHIGSDTDGTTTPPDVGWAHVLKREIDFIGRRSLMRPENLRTDRFQAVAFQSSSGVQLNVGSHVLGNPPSDSQGYITSCVFSHTLNRWVALGMLRSGRARLGETVSILTPTGAVPATIVPPNAYDARGVRLSA